MNAEGAEQMTTLAEAATAAGAGSASGSASVTVSAEVAKAAAEAPEDPGNLTKLTLTALGNRPYKCPEAVAAWWRLRSTHDSVSGLFDTLYLVRRTRARKNNKTTRGRLHADAQNLLRAAIVFTSAGLDATVQALISHAVPKLITSPDGTARLVYETFLCQQATAPSAGREFLIALKRQDLQDALIELYVKSKTKASFQGSADLHDRACGALGITNKQIPRKKFAALDEFFSARNDIAHQLDMDNVSQSLTKPQTKIRGQQDARRMCDGALLLARALIMATADNLRHCRTVAASGDAGTRSQPAKL